MVVTTAGVYQMFVCQSSPFIIPMKTKRSNRLLAAAIFALAAGTSVYASTLTWDTAPGTIGAGDSAITGGTGAWDESTGNWTTDGGANNIAWVNANIDSAIFSGAAGTVTLSSITANNLTFNDNAGYTLGSGSLTLAGATPTITTNVDAAISSQISGTVGMIKDGTGVLTLTGANDYTGGTTINDGTLQIGDGTTNGTVNGTYSIASGGVLKLNYNASGATAPNWADITGAGTLTLETAKNFDYGWGQGALGGGFTGTLQIDGGRIYTNGAGSLGGTTAVVVTPGGHLGMWEGGTFPQDFTIAGTGYGESGYESALRMGNGGKTATITGTVALSGNATVGASGGVGHFAGVISGGSGAGLTIGTSAQGGDIIFSAANTYAGTTTINNGYLYIGNGGTTGTLGTGDVVNNAGLIFNRNSTYSVGNTITGSGTMYVRSSGTVTLSGTGANTNNLDVYDATAILSKTGANAVGGYVSIGIGSNYAPGASLRLAASNQIADTSIVTLNDGHYGGGAYFQLMGNSETIGGLSSNLNYSTTAVVENGGAANSTLTLNVASGSVTFGNYGGYYGWSSQTIRDGSGGGTLSVVKTGAGTQVIGRDGVGSNVTYTGGTTINGGVLEFVGGANIGRGTVTVNDTGTFRLAWQDASNSLGRITINDGGLVTASANWQWVQGGLTMNGGELGATVAGHGNYGNYLTNSGSWVFGGSSQSLISADVRIWDTNKEFNVGITGDPSGVDLLMTGPLKHVEGVVWGFMTKTGLGTMQLTNTTNSIGSITVNGGKMIFKDQMSGMGNGGLINNALVDADISVPVSFGYAISGSGAFTKLGSDTLTLTGTNTCTGATTINAGTLALSNGAAIANTGAVTLADVAGATLLLNNSETIGSLNGGGATGGNVSLGSNTLTTGDANTNASYAGVISGTGGGFTKTGLLTQTLSGANDYTGATTVSGGTLNVTGSLTSAVTVNSGATLSGEGGSTTSTLTLDAGSTILGVAQSAGAGTAFRAAGAVTAAATVTIAGNDGNLAAGTHNMDVLGYGTTPGTANFSTASFRAAVLTDDTANSKITLAYETALRTWNLEDGEWDNMVTEAWQEGDFLFAQNDLVVFDDSGLGSGTTIDVTLNSLVLPVDVKFDNDSSDFVISGTGAIGGPTSITKTQGGNVIMSTANTYTGGTTVSGGMLQANVGTDAGAKTMFGTGPVSVSGATLKILAGSTGNAMSFANNLVLDNANFTSEDAVITYSGTISLTNANTVHVQWGNKNAIFSNTVSGTGSITKTGGGSLILAGANDYSGTTTITTGTLQVGNGGATGSLGSGAVTNNGTLTFNRSNTYTVANDISGTGNIVVNNGNNVTLGGSVACNNINFPGGNRTMTISGTTPNVIGTMTFNQDGHGTVILAKSPGVDALSGTIYVGNGYASQVRVMLADNEQMADSTIVSMGGSWGGHGGRAWFDLMGYGETIAGLTDGTSQAYVRNMAAAPSVLTIAGSGSYSYGTGNAVIENGSSGTIGITMNGSNTQELLGTRIDYTGPTTVTTGTLRFLDLDDCHSGSLAIDGGATMEVRNVIRDFARFTNTVISGTGTFVKSGGYTLNTGNSGGYARWNMTGGLIDIQEGTFNNDYTTPPTAWGNNKASLNVAAGATVNLVGGNHMNVDALTGAGTVQDNNSWGTGIFTVGTNDGSGEFTGVIKDAGGPITLVKVGIGTQILSGTVDNTSALVSVTGGTLVLAKDAASQRAAAGVTDVGTGATLKFAGSGGDQVYGGSGSGAASLVAMTGGTIDFNGRNEGWDRLTGTGTVTNTAAATTSIMTLGEANGGGTFAGVIEDGAGTMAVTKVGTGTLSLTGTNTHTGDTTVSGGILAVDGDAIADTATLVINGGQVAPTGTEVVAVLDFGSGPVANGTYGATGSGATHIDDTHFTGTAGVVQVGPAGTTYESWAAEKGLTGPDALAGADPDHDGIPNSVEMVLGGHPKTGMDTALLPTIELVNEDLGAGATDYLLFTYRRTAVSEDAGVIPNCETSTILATPWTVVLNVSPNVIQVDTDFAWADPAAPADTDRVRVYVPLTGTELFGRLNVFVPAP